jgi:ABC-2 type transport system ATP-binding protein
MNEGNLVALGTPEELKSEIGGDVVLFHAAHDASLLADRIRARFHVDTTVLDNQVRIERTNAHRFVTEVVEAFPGEVEALSVSKPALEDVFIRRTGHKFWSEKDETPESTAKNYRR